MAQTPPSRRTYGFGAFEADPVAGELRRRGVRLRLQEQPFRVLTLLLEHPGEIITRKTIRHELWPEDTFVDYENSLNSIVARLREVLGDSAQTPRFIETVPRRGYRFVADVHIDGGSSARVGITEGGQTIGASARIVGSETGKKRWAFGLALLIALAGAATGVLWWRSSHQTSSPPLVAVPLTTDPGMETQPALSPDGNQVAYCWIPEGQETADIYVKVIGSGEPLRRTTDPADDYNPVWSPDGTQIAFIRRPPGGVPEIRIMPALRGPERRVVETCMPMPMFGSSRSRYSLVNWHPNGKQLVIADRGSSNAPLSLFLLSLSDKKKLRLTFPPENSYFGDVAPAFSPTGPELVFVRSQSAEASDLYLLAFPGRSSPAGEPERLTPYSRQMSSPTWSSAGEAMVYAVSSGLSTGLWRLELGNRRTPQRIAHIGAGGLWPVMAPRSKRLVYGRLASDYDVWRFDLRQNGRPAQSSVRLISSTRLDANAQYSPDGGRIAFRSDRSGHPEIWVCDSDGSNWRQITTFRGPQTSGARWSPDGRQIVFVSWANGTGDLFVVSADGGEPRQLTTSLFSDASPRWSPDGGWIYFRSNRSGENQVWRIPAGGGNAERITEHGATGEVILSPDGRFVYYAAARVERAELWRIPAGGGKEERIPVSLNGAGSFTVTQFGVYAISPPNKDGVRYLQFLDLRTSGIRKVTEIAGRLGWGLSVSPDSRYLLYTQLIDVGSDLMLVENFR